MQLFRFNKLMDISYVYPSICREEKDGNGMLNIESIRFEDKEGNFLSVSFGMGDDKDPYIQCIQKGKKIPNTLTITLLKDMLQVEHLETLEKNFLEELERNSVMSHLYFHGKPTDWDEDFGPESSDINIGFIEEGCYGKFIKINVSGGKRNGLNLNQAEQQQVVRETINILKTLIQ